MVTGKVTLLTEKRWPGSQQIRLGRSVRAVTQQAILGNGIVFKQKRSALFGVATKTVFVGAYLPDFTINTAVALVTIETHNFGFPDRVSRGHRQGMFYLHMALQAHRLPGSLIHDGIGGSMYLMAVVTSEVNLLMDTGRPVHSFCVVVTRKTGLVPLAPVSAVRIGDINRIPGTG